MQPPAAGSCYAFGPFTFIPCQQLLLRGRSPVRSGARALDILHLLVTRAGEAISKEELIGFTWPETHVDTGNLKVHISALRRLLGDTWPSSTYIATVAGRGYRFVAPVVSTPYVAALVQEVEPSAEMLADAGTVIGRDAEIDHVARLLPSSRLLTLVGTAGVGKTTLAVSTGRRLETAYPDGVAFVDLGAITDPSLLPHSIANSLGLRGRPSDIVPSVVNVLRVRRVLLILDNCEHLLLAVAEFCRLLYEKDVAGSVLATSREPIGILEEKVLRVAPLLCPKAIQPDDPAGLVEFPAVALFAYRAAEAADVQLKTEDLPDVGRICTLLDGLPLAIEIAAARLTSLTPLELLKSLEELFRRSLSLGGDGADDPLWAAFDWSYQLLSSQEAALYRLLSVFAGPFQIIDVVVMARLGGLDPHETTVVLGRLVARSLVVAAADGDAISYRLLECSRRFAARRLIQDEALHSRARQQHAQLVSSLLRRSEEEWPWTATRPWRERYEPRIGDLREALDWCFEDDHDPALGIDLTAGAVRLWDEQSSVFEQLQQVGRALRQGAAAPYREKERVRLATSRAWTLTLAAPLDARTDESWEAALEQARSADIPTLTVAALSASATYPVYTGRCGLALAKLRECAVIAERSRSQSMSIETRRRTAFAAMHYAPLDPLLEELEELAKMIAGEVNPSSVTRYRDERLVGIQSALALTRWLTGSFEQAVDLMQALLDRLSGSQHLLGQSHVLALVALPIAFWRRDLDALRSACGDLRGNLDILNIGIWEGVVSFYSATLRFMEGDEEAIKAIESALDRLASDGLLVRMPMYLGILAECYLARHDVPKAEQAIALAQERQSLSGETWFRPELLRIRACIAARQGNWEAAEQQYLNAHEQAVAQNARFFELRAAIGLADQKREDTLGCDVGKLLRGSRNRLQATSYNPDLLRADQLIERYNAGREALDCPGPMCDRRLVNRSSVNPSAPPSIPTPTNGVRQPKRVATPAAKGQARGRSAAKSAPRHFAA